MYEIYLELLEKSGKKHSDVSKATGIPASTFSDWKKGKSSPKQDKLQKIADYFGVSVEYLTTGEQPPNYYLNEETAQIAQEIFDNPNLKALFETASRNTSPKQLQLVKDMLEEMKKTNPDG